MVAVPSTGFIGKRLAQEIKQEGFEVLDEALADGDIMFLNPPGLRPVRQVRAEPVRLYTRTKMSDTAPHEGKRVHLKKVKALGKRSGIPVKWMPERGKGSHGSLYFGDHKTIVRNPKDELKTGTFHAMLKQLGITERDL